MTVKGISSFLFYFFLIALVVASTTPIFGLAEVTRTAALQISVLFLIFSLTAGRAHRGERQTEIAIMTAIALVALVLITIVAPFMGIVFINTQLELLTNFASVGLIGYFIQSF